jgi:dolichol-phosphate mannosyltransferase
MPKVIVVVPTYNEAQNLPVLAKTLLELPIPDIELLVVDDNSPDGTGRIAEELSAQTNGKVHVLHRPGKLGLGTAYIAGFKKAIELGADVIIQMDADFSHDPKYIPEMVEKLKNSDLVIGSRYIRGGKLDESWGIHRRLLSWWANSVWVRLILNTPTADSTAGFRAWRRETLIGMDLDRIQANGYVYQVEVTYLAYRLGYRICEVPIHFVDRKMGKSKMGLKVQLEAARGVFSVRSRYSDLTPADRASVPGHVMMEPKPAISRPAR